MSFSESMAQIMERCEGAMACSLMGYDGIAIETRTAPAASIDVGSALIEFSTLAGQIKQTAAAAGLGEPQEFSVAASQGTLVLRELSPEYFLAIAVSAGGNTAKARYLARVYGPGIAAELGG